jgi:hypothetical protein
MLAGFGVNTFRTSVEWARIEPEEGRFDPEAIAHYRDVLETCHWHGIAPMVTYHHFTSPLWLLADGGWHNPRTAARFASYCERVTRDLGDLFHVACTLNEANLPFLLSALGLGAKTPEDRRQMPVVAGCIADGVDVRGYTVDTARQLRVDLRVRAEVRTRRRRPHISEEDAEAERVPTWRARPLVQLRRGPVATSRGEPTRTLPRLRALRRAGRRLPPGGPTCTA